MEASSEVHNSLEHLEWSYHHNKLLRTEFRNPVPTAITSTPTNLYYRIQSAPAGKVNILKGHSIGHCKQKKKKCICTCVPFRTVSETRVISLHNRTAQYSCCTQTSNTPSSHELQSALMSTVEFSKMY
jgi:hypothetical protein